MKLGYVLLDGCGDLPHPSLNYTTPLEAAYTPHLDLLAGGSRLGTVVTVKKGVAPESDIAVFNMLGYSFGKGYPGRGVVEAVGSGMLVRDGDLALRANLASVSGRKIIDRRAGRNLTDVEARAIAEEVNGIRLKGATFEFKSTVAYRGVLLIRGEAPLSAEISNTDPAYAKVGGFGAAKETGKEDVIMKCLPEGESPGAKRAAAIVNEFTEKALRLLSSSRVNADRIRSGRLPANSILLRDAGDHLPDLRPFKERYGVTGTALVEMPAEVGIAKLLGMKMVTVADRNDVALKAAQFARELKEGRLVYVHIKGPDEFGHEGDAVGKKRSIESIDRDFFSKVASISDGLGLGVSCDHSTPCTLKRHSADPVPLMLRRGGKGDGMRFTERNARKGSLGQLMGREVLGAFLRQGPAPGSRSS
ncbi:MAG: 2,3-bisphosphoglycerate-independent phosphoglycerate mutase [Thaumarchaeota archaeon]|nr:2,3-bisphosphoglycerate-independent phosphoglycerate mutase [Nitrososphaerota archaeon]